MGGENSKSSGELGEKLTDALFKIIGWDNTINNLSITCSLPAKHNSRQSHGIDKLFLYNNPFFEGVTDVVTVSVKHKLKGYQRTSGAIRGELKRHIAELSQIVACAKVNAEVKSIINSFPKKKRQEHRGLLVWLHNDRSTLKDDLREIFGATELSRDHDVPVFLIDSGRASFIFNAISHFKSTAGFGSYKFYYPRLGNVITPDSEQWGPFLPLELIASDMIPIKYEKGEKPALCLYVRDKFSLPALKKAYALALDFGSGWVTDISIGFEDFDSSPTHTQWCDEAKLAFPEIAGTLSVFSYESSVLSLLESK
jgi:hypothetical protein